MSANSKSASYPDWRLQTPLVMSAIMWGINTEFEIEYIDCLFNCFSAMTVTGLTTVNLSTLSPVQQAMLFVQMVIGSPVSELILSHMCLGAHPGRLSCQSS